MKAEPIPDVIWNAVAHLLPEPPSRTGRPQLENRLALSGILYVRLSEIGWNQLGARVGFGSGRTCLRRLEAWTESGAWARVERALLELFTGEQGELIAEQLTDWRRDVEDSVRTRAASAGLSINDFAAREEAPESSAEAAPCSDEDAALDVRIDPRYLTRRMIAAPSRPIGPNAAIVLQRILLPTLP